MKPHLIALGIAVLLMGLTIQVQAQQISRLLLSKNLTIEIPPYQFRVHTIRVWKQDTIRLTVQVRGGQGEIYLLVERIHLHIGDLTETGRSRRIIKTIIYNPGLIKGRDNTHLTADLDGHLNIILNNTQFPQPKTVKLRQVFEKSMKIQYATLLIRNFSLLFGGIILLLGLFEKPSERTGLLPSVEQ